MAKCFLCGTPMEFRFKVRDHMRPEVGAEYAVEWCQGCAYGRIAGEFTPGEVGAFYATGYYTHEETSEQAKPARWLDRLRMHMAWRRDGGIDLAADEVARTVEHPVLCDVGCGAGQAMAKFKLAGYEAVGIEPDAAARALAERHGEVHEGVAEWIPPAVAGRRFDVVLLSHVLEHCIDPLAALKNVKGLLAAGGTAILEVPNCASAGFEMYGPAWFFSDIPRHLQFFTEGALHEALAHAGLRVTRTIYTGYARQLSPEWLAAQQTIRRQARISGWDGSAWGLLARTAFAADARKYDSIRVHAVHSDEQA